jgi:hypothetical protein
VPYLIQMTRSLMHVPKKNELLHFFCLVVTCEVHDSYTNGLLGEDFRIFWGRYIFWVKILGYFGGFISFPSVN